MSRVAPMKTGTICKSLRPIYQAIRSPPCRRYFWRTLPLTARRVRITGFALRAPQIRLARLFSGNKRWGALMRAPHLLLSHERLALFGDQVVHRHRVPAELHVFHVVRPATGRGGVPQRDRGEVLEELLLGLRELLDGGVLVVDYEGVAFLHQLVEGFIRVVP